jgi:hypothetical protein
MKTRLLLLCASMGVVISLSCNKPTPPLPSPPEEKEAKQTPDSPPNPFCSLEAPQKQGFPEGTVANIWNLKAFGLTSLSARLLIIDNGNIKTVSEVVYKWDKWEITSPAATGHLILIIQDGLPFGVKGKQLPMLSLELQNAQSHTRTSNRAGFLLEGNLQSKSTSSWSSSNQMGKHLIHSQLFLPADREFKGVTLGSDLETTIASSKGEGGRTILAVELDAKTKE